MTDPNREREIFEAALDLPTDEQRLAYVEAACGDDEALAERLARLLSPDDDSFLPDNPQSEAAESHLAEGPGTVIGRYKLLEQIGEGGFGVVYMAEQLEPVKRRVALKIIKPGMDSKQVIARFEAERQALALMDHPNIAQVYDAGATESGRPYFVMELVQGIPITTFCREQNLGLEKRLKLFVDVCSAVQHAHQKGIIHRDLKPTNILVTLHGDRPVPKVIDFGIAKATAQQLTEQTLFTQFQQFLGTPAYMSPEQASLSGLDVDTRSDVYSLGVLLYELLTGSPPFDSERLLSAGLDEMRRILREEEPPKPSTKISRSRSNDGEPGRTAPASPQIKVTSELDWIVLKALEKDRDRRYETANGLAADLRRYLNDEPVSAAAPRLGYQFSKLCRRHRTLAASAAAIVAVLLISSVVCAWYAYEANAAQNEQHRLFQEAKRSQQQALNAADLANAQTEALIRERYAATMQLAGEAGQQGEWEILRASLRACDPSQRHWEWHHLANKLPHRVRIDAERTPIFTPEGLLVMVATADGGTTVKVWNPRDGEPLRTLITDDAPINMLASSRSDGTWATGGFDGTITKWNEQGQKQWSIPAHSERVDGLDLSPDGSRIVSAGRENVMKLWDAADGTPLREWGPFPVTMLRNSKFSPDQRFVSAGTLGASGFETLPLWDQHTGEARFTDNNLGLDFRDLVHSADGLWFATSGADRRVFLWDAASGELVRSFNGIMTLVESLVFSPDATKLAIGGDEGVRIVDTHTAKVLYSFRMPDVSKCWRMSFSDDGELFAAYVRTKTQDHQTYVWELSPPAYPETLALGSKAWSVAFSRDGRYLASGGTDSVIKIWDAATLGLVSSIPVDDGRFVAFSADGGRVLSGGTHGAVRFWDVESGRITRSFEGGDAYLHSAILSPDERYVAASGHDKLVRLWDAETGELIHQLEGHEPDSFSTYAVAFSPDSGKLASAGADGTVRLWNCESGRASSVLRGTGQMVSVKFRPDGNVLCAGSNDKAIRRWRPDTGEELAALVGAHRDTVWALAYSPDGKRLASGDASGLLAIWDTATGMRLLTMETGQVGLWSIDWSPFGQVIATAGGDGTVRLWDGQPAGGSQDLQPDALDHGTSLATAGDPAHASLINSPDRWDTLRPLYLQALYAMQESSNEAKTISALAERLATRREWSGAHGCFWQIASRSGDFEAGGFTMIRLKSAAVALACNQLSDYQEFCRRWLHDKGSQQTPVQMERLLKACLLAPPDAAPGITREAVALGREHDSLLANAASGGWRCWMDLVRGLVNLRADDLPTAHRFLLSADREADAWLACRAASKALLAMVHHGEGDSARAQAALAEAEQLISPYLKPREGLTDWHDWLFAELFYQEARDLVEARRGDQR